MAQEEPLELLEAREIVTAGEPGDRLALSWEQRRKSRFRARTANGTEVGLFLARGSVLVDGSLLRASDGTVIRVVAAPEDVSTVASPDAMLLARVAYHLGNRHVRMQVGPGFIRYRHDRAIDELVRTLGATVTTEEVPFEPEHGALEHHDDQDIAS